MDAAGSTLRSIGPRKYAELVDLINVLDRESERCAKARAYYAACVLQGAVLEALLIAMCDCYIDDVRAWRLKTSPRVRPRGPLLKWDLDTLIRVALALEWLPVRRGPRARRQVGDWLAVVKELRNLIHPGRHMRDYPTLRLRKAHYSDAYAIVRAATSHLDAKVNADLSAEIDRQEKRRAVRRPVTGK
jgi:hypothetical protein